VVSTWRVVPTPTATSITGSPGRDPDVSQYLSRSRNVLRRSLGEARIYLRATYAGRADTRFVIFAQGRTGTWLLHDLLNAHPGVWCDKEILAPQRLAPYAFLEGASRRPGTAYGCHVQIRHLLETHHLDPAAFLHRMHDAGWRII